jgi:hypothetical protein
MEAKQGALAGARTARNTSDQNNILQHPVSYPVPSVSGILMILRRKLNQAKGIVMVYQRHLSDMGEKAEEQQIIATLHLSIMLIHLLQPLPLQTRLLIHNRPLRRTFTVLGLESSADDTCAAVVTHDRRILSNVVARQDSLYVAF